MTKSFTKNGSHIAQNVIQLERLYNKFIDDSLEHCEMQHFVELIKNEYHENRIELCGSYFRGTLF